MQNRPKCEPCRINEIDAEGTYTVSGEPWCEECVDDNSGACFQCNGIFDMEDNFHGPEGREGEPCCYDCGQKDATNK